MLRKLLCILLLISATTIARNTNECNPMTTASFKGDSDAQAGEEPLNGVEPLAAPISGAARIPADGFCGSLQTVGTCCDLSKMEARAAQQKKRLDKRLRKALEGAEYLLTLKTHAKRMADMCKEETNIQHLIKSYKLPTRVEMEPMTLAEMQTEEADETFGDEAAQIKLFIQECEYISTIKSVKDQKKRWKKFLRSIKKVARGVKALSNVFSGYTKPYFWERLNKFARFNYAKVATIELNLMLRGFANSKETDVVVIKQRPAKPLKTDADLQEIIELDDFNTDQVKAKIKTQNEQFQMYMHNRRGQDGTLSPAQIKTEFSKVLKDEADKEKADLAARAQANKDEFDRKISGRSDLGSVNPDALRERAYEILEQKARDEEVKSLKDLAKGYKEQKSAIGIVNTFKNDNSEAIQQALEQNKAQVALIERESENEYFTLWSSKRDSYCQLTTTEDNGNPDVYKTAVMNYLSTVLGDYEQIGAKMKAKKKRLSEIKIDLGTTVTTTTNPAPPSNRRLLTTGTSGSGQTLEQQLAYAQGQLSQAETRLSDAQKDSSSTPNQLSILQSEVDTAEAEVTRIQAEIAARDAANNSGSGSGTNPPPPPPSPTLEQQLATAQAALTVATTEHDDAVKNNAAQPNIDALLVKKQDAQAEVTRIEGLIAAAQNSGSTSGSGSGTNPPPPTLEQQLATAEQALQQAEKNKNDAVAAGADAAAIQGLDAEITAAQNEKNRIQSLIDARDAANNNGSTTNNGGNPPPPPPPKSLQEILEDIQKNIDATKQILSIAKTANNKTPQELQEIEAQLAKLEAEFADLKKNVDAGVIVDPSLPPKDQESVVVRLYNEAYQALKDEKDRDASSSKIPELEEALRKAEKNLGDIRDNNSGDDDKSVPHIPKVDDATQKQFKDFHEAMEKAEKARDAYYEAKDSGVTGADLQALKDAHEAAKQEVESKEASFKTTASLDDKVISQDELDRIDQENKSYEDMRKQIDEERFKQNFGFRPPPAGSGPAPAVDLDAKYQEAKAKAENHVFDTIIKPFYQKEQQICKDTKNSTPSSDELKEWSEKFIRHLKKLIEEERIEYEVNLIAEARDVEDSKKDDIRKEILSEREMEKKHMDMADGDTLAVALYVKQIQNDKQLTAAEIEELMKTVEYSLKGEDGILKEKTAGMNSKGPVDINSADEQAKFDAALTEALNELKNQSTPPPSARRVLEKAPSTDPLANIPSPTLSSSETEFYNPDDILSSINFADDESIKGAYLPAADSPQVADEFANDPDFGSPQPFTREDATMIADSITAVVDEADSVTQGRFAKAKAKIEECVTALQTFRTDGVCLKCSANVNKFFNDFTKRYYVASKNCVPILTHCGPVLAAIVPANYLFGNMLDFAFAFQSQNNFDTIGNNLNQEVVDMWKGCEDGAACSVGANAEKLCSYFGLTGDHPDIMISAQNTDKIKVIGTQLKDDTMTIGGTVRLIRLLQENFSTNKRVLATNIETEGDGIGQLAIDQSGADMNNFKSGDLNAATTNDNKDASNTDSTSSASSKVFATSILLAILLALIQRIQ